AALARLLPEFHRSEPKQGDEEDEAADDRADINGALRSLHEPEIIDDKLAAGAVILTPFLPKAAASR
ncbi:MAG: DUF2017 family protein, partial [Candidatus Nanopelagicales bacterium]